MKINKEKRREKEKIKGKCVGGGKWEGKKNRIKPNLNQGQSKTARTTIQFSG